MNVCLLGECGTQLDEGMKNTSVNLRDNLSESVESVTLLDLRTVGSVAFWDEIRGLDPDIVHLIPGPTPQGLLLLRALGAWKRCKTVATATQPRFVDALLYGAPALAPDRLLAQSSRIRDRFSNAGFEVNFVPSGVDVDDFAPVSESRKRRIRRDLGLPEEERLFLHVGHFKEGREATALTHLRKFGEVIVIGSPSTGPQREIVSELRSSGCTVLTEYVERIERYYQAADVYAFPTRDASHSIQAPLSVFEAMACNLPVVTTRFGGLADCFEEGDGLRFVPAMDAVTESTLAFDAVNTRQKVQKYSWQSISNTVCEIYEQL